VLGGGLSIRRECSGCDSSTQNMGHVQGVENSLPAASHYLISILNNFPGFFCRWPGTRGRKHVGGMADVRYLSKQTVYGCHYRTPFDGGGSSKPHLKTLGQLASRRIACGAALAPAANVIRDRGVVTALIKDRKLLNSPLRKKTCGSYSWLRCGRGTSSWSRSLESSSYY